MMFMYPTTIVFVRELVVWHPQPEVSIPILLPLSQQRSERDLPRKDVEPEKFISAFSQHLKRQGDVKRLLVKFFLGRKCFSVSILGVYMGVPST